MTNPFSIRIPWVSRVRCRIHIEQCIKALHYAVTEIYQMVPCIELPIRGKLPNFEFLFPIILRQISINVVVLSNRIKYKKYIKQVDPEHGHQERFADC